MARGAHRLLIVAALGAALVVAALATAQAKVLSASDRKIFTAAVQAAEKDDWAAARALAAKGRNRVAAKIIEWMDLVRPGPGHSFDEFARFMRENPKWPGQITLQIQAEKAMPPDYPADAVIAWFGDRRPRTVAGTLLLGRALLEKGLKDAAADVLRRGWIELDMEPADEALFLARHETLLRPADHQARLDRLLWAEKADAAARMMDRVDPGHRALAQARLALMSDSPEAGDLVAAVPQDLKRDPGLVFDLARWHRRHGRYEAAAATLELLPPTAPRPAKVWDEMHDAARRAFARGDLSQAYRLACNHGAERGVPFAEGEWLAGWLALRFLDDRRAAYQHFTRLYAGVTSAISQSRAAYWAGRAAEELGDVAQAQTWYRAAAANLTTYYGQLAAHKIGKAEALTFTPPAKPSKAEADAFRKNELVQAVRILAELGQDDRVRTFTLRLSDLMTTPGEQRLLADLAVDLDREDLAVKVAKKARQDGVELIPYLYPLHKLPPGEEPEAALVLAIIRQESAFSTDAVSPAGAVGMMQLMPATAKRMAAKLKLKFTPKKLVDDDFNVRLGRAYLNDLLDAFSGSYVLAVSSYNAGPSRVQDWIRQYGDPRDANVDVIDWIESIPFDETRNYVQRVMENLQVYRHRLAKKQIAMSLEADLLRVRE
ncbi:MAG: lytic transglycosylase domain-containing protein [Rhodospirillaceae bacterium]|nr:lytic transglycosylase domain-containing protein [Rhodospirillaceae bacterium]